MPNHRRTRHLAASGLIAFAFVFAIAAAANARPVTTRPTTPPPGGVDTDAATALKHMSDYLASLKKFSVTADSTTDVITTDGQKLTLGATSRIAVERPNKLRSDRVSSAKELTFLYDGKTISVLDKRRNLFAQSDAPNNLDDAIDFARNDLGLEAPGADLLMKDASAVLLADVTSGMVVGNEEIDGIPVQHLAFRGHDTDFQIWIELGARPLPRRFMITSKTVTGSPDFTVEMHEWNTQFTPSATFFTFVAPRGAQRIDFVTAKKSDNEPDKSGNSKEGRAP